MEEQAPAHLHAEDALQAGEHLGQLAQRGAGLPCRHRLRAAQPARLLVADLQGLTGGREGEMKGARQL